jgi:hypothetical protein
MTWPSSIALYASHLTNTHLGAKKMPHQSDHISVSEYRGGLGVYRARGISAKPTRLQSCHR